MKPGTWRRVMALRRQLRLCRVVLAGIANQHRSPAKCREAAKATLALLDSRASKKINHR